MAETVRLACASCGAPLELPSAVRFATCGHCGSTLTVVASGGAVWSELRQVAEQTKHVAENTARTASAAERVAGELERARQREAWQRESRDLRAARAHLLNSREAGSWTQVIGLCLTMTGLAPSGCGLTIGADGDLGTAALLLALGVPFLVVGGLMLRSTAAHDDRVHERVRDLDAQLDVLRLRLARDDEDTLSDDERRSP